MANQANHYDAGNIQVLEGLEAVRMRPGMYIGTTSTRGLHHLLWEIVDNAIDEASNGFADEVRVTLHTDGSASVYDNGRGMPVDEHPTMHAAARRSFSPCCTRAASSTTRITAIPAVCTAWARRSSTR